MKVTLSDGKPSKFEMSYDEVLALVADHVDKLLQQKFGMSTNVDANNISFNCGREVFDGVYGTIQNSPKTPVISEIEL